MVRATPHQDTPAGGRSTPVPSAPTRVFLPAEAFVGWLLPAAIDAARCVALVDQLGRRGFDATGEHYPRAYRDNDRLVFDDPDLAASLFAELAERLPDELHAHGDRWQLVGLNPRFRACRYTHGQAFCIHRDGPFVPDEDVRSLLTVQLYLDDAPDRVGGRTRFYADARGDERWAAITPERGAAIVFDHRAWHDGEAVTAGIKHVLRTDAMYRRTGSAAPAARGAAADPAEIIGRHRGYAWRALVRRDGSIASAGRDGTVRRWRHPRHEGAGRGNLLGTVELGAGSVTTLVEDDAGRLWCGTRSGVVAVIDPAGHIERVASDVGAVLAMSRLDDHVIVATSRGTLIAFDRAGDASWTTATHAGWAWAVTTHRDELVSCGHDGRIVVLDRAGRARTFTELGVPLRAILSLGDELLVGDTRGWVHRFARDGRVVAASRAHLATVTALAAAPDGSWISGSEDGAVKRWRDGREVAARTVSDVVTSVAIDGAGTVIASGYDGAIRVVAL